MTTLTEFAEFAQSLCDIEARYDELLDRLSTMSLITAASVLLATADTFSSTPMLPLDIDKMSAPEKFNCSVETCCLLRLDLKTVLPLNAMELLVAAHDMCATPVPRRLLRRSKIFLRYGPDAFMHQFLRDTRRLSDELRRFFGRRGERDRLPTLASLLVRNEPY